MFAAITLPPPPPSVITPPVIVDGRTTVVPWADFTAALARAKVVMVGETHDDPLHHQIQAEVFAAMPSGTVLGLEMLDHTQQPTLDSFMSGAMSEKDFADFWKKQWGFDYSLYKPLFDAAKAKGASALALNVPRDVIRQVARGGLASLTPAQRSLIAPRIEPITHPKYLAYVNKALDEHGPMDPARRARMLEAQAVWNETMAWKASASQMMIAAGSGHTMYGDGIGGPLRRSGISAIVAVLPGPPSEPDAADYFRQP
jgi:uncharacterized iron-regulated protein